MLLTLTMSDAPSCVKNTVFLPTSQDTELPKPTKCTQFELKKLFERWQPKFELQKLFEKWQRWAPLTVNYIKNTSVTIPLQC